MKPAALTWPTVVTSILAAGVLSACGDMAQLPVSAGTGPNPELPAPEKSLFPTVTSPRPKAGKTASGRSPPTGSQSSRSQPASTTPRWVYTLPNGDVLVAETNAPPNPTTPPASAAGS